ncbi:MAG: hypothetical protein DRN96_07365 [Thermoproteota archaeon]|nr:MAG: hypothetical protein DRN96_07365 [Candidatus Korarchaeota archaeon]
MDLVEAVKIYRSRRKYYRLKSPIMECFNYLDSRHEASEREVPYSEVNPTLERLLRSQVERLIADFIAQLLEGRREYMLKPEVDFIVTVRGKPAAVGEVKWGTYTRADITVFLEKTASIPGRKLFIAREKQADHPEAMVMDASDITSLARELYSSKQLKQPWRRG